MDRKVYPRDISQGQSEVIRGLLEHARHKTAPRKIDLYDLFCAILVFAQERRNQPKTENLLATAPRWLYDI